MRCRTRTTSKMPFSPGDPWLWGLAALSLPVAGWLLGYGLSPWINGLMTLQIHSANRPTSFRSVPVLRQGWNSQNMNSPSNGNSSER